MTDKQTGGPAFPGFDYIDQYGKKNPEGMTLRDYFAAKAMSSMLSQAPDDWHEDINDLAIASYEVADAMLEARDD